MSTPSPTMGRADALATTTAMLAQAVLAQGRIDEAGELCAAAARATAPDDVFTEVIRRGVQASVLARQGACAEARELADSALEMTAATDLLTQHGDAMLRLAEVTHECSPASVAVRRRVAPHGASLFMSKRATWQRRHERGVHSTTSQGKASHGTRRSTSTRSPSKTAEGIVVSGISEGFPGAKLLHRHVVLQQNEKAAEGPRRWSRSGRPTPRCEDQGFDNWSGGGRHRAVPRQHPDPGRRVPDVRDDDVV